MGHILMGNGNGATLPPDEFGLTARQWETLRWAAEGKRNGAIATIMNCKPCTVTKHLYHAFQKIGVETRTEAALWYHEQKRPA